LIGRRRFLRRRWWRRRRRRRRNDDFLNDHGLKGFLEHLQTAPRGSGNQSPGKKQMQNDHGNQAADLADRPLGPIDKIHLMMLKGQTVHCQ
jgi:hypothetical protein